MKKILSYLFIAGASYLGYSQCTPIMAPWIETFQSNSVPTCWIDSGSSLWEYVNASGGFSAYGAANAGEHTGTPGSWAIGMDGSNNSGADISYLETPEIDISALTYPAFGYWVFSNNIDQSCNNEVRVEVWDGTAWNLEETYAQNFGSQYVKRVVSLGAYSGVVRMRFTVDAMPTSCGSAFFNDILFDDVEVFDCTPSFNTISATSCGYYTSPSGKLWHDAGTYVDTVANEIGCDSIITVNLTTNNTFASQTISNICGAFTTPSGVVIGTDGTYTDTSANAAGCDSVITYNLTFSNSYNTFSAQDCDSYTAPSGAVYTTSGVYMDTITNAAGCDSIMTINLTVSYANSITIIETSCGGGLTGPSGTVYNTTGVYLDQSLTSINGCDSLVYFNVTIATGNVQTFNISACDTWTSPSGLTTTTSSGTFTETWVSVDGCDSSEIFNVSIFTVNTSAAFVSALTVEAAETGATYQWVDCNNNNANIQGATDKTFTATVNGDYACIVEKNGCTEMTNCVRLGSLGIDETNNTFSIYPNPSNGAFSIELTELSSATTVKVTNAAGQLVHSSRLNDTRTDINLNVEAGMYFVTIENATSTLKKSMIIE